MGIGINYKTNETKKRLIDIITESQLQPCILRMIFEDLTNQLRRIEEDAIQKEIESEREELNNIKNNKDDSNENENILDGNFVNDND